MTNPASALETQKRLVNSLLAGRGLPPHALPPEHLQTHISHILLAGDIAYKLKKPLNLGFLNFSSLNRRRHCCEEEVRLNRRLAPQLYLDCIAICGTPDNPTLGGAPEDAIEFAVRMQQFDRTKQFDELARNGRLGGDEIVALAGTLAAFHQTAAPDPDGCWGAPEAVHQLAMDNFQALRPLLTSDDDRGTLEQLESWTRTEFECIAGTLQQRLRQLSIRECHGDLHLGNIVLIDHQPVVFDCIEFSDSLRWIDVMCEIAFLYMDLVNWQRRDLADLFLDRYLEHTGDYAGLMVLPYYLVYRALVRAKIAAIRAQQTERPQRVPTSGGDDLHQHLALAQQLAEPRHPFLAITHGVSGSGKSTVADVLVRDHGAMRLRSDVVRKTLFGLTPHERTGATTKDGIYADNATERTYARLQVLANQILAAGWPVIVDATNLRCWQRHLFAALASAKAVPYLILDCRAPESVLRLWIRERLKMANDPSDADESVLRYQLSNEEPLAPAEMAHVIRIRTDQAGHEAQLGEQLAARL